MDITSLARRALGPELCQARLQTLIYGTGQIRVPNFGSNENCVVGSPGCNCREVGRQTLSESFFGVDRGIRLRAVLAEDGFEARLRYGTFCAEVGPDRWPDFLKVWRQLGVVHNASINVKEIHYSNGEITNEAQLAQL